MGLVCTKILFELGMPSFNIIQDAYFKQTGLRICLVASLHMFQLPTNSEQVLATLQQDAERIEQLEQEFNLVRKNARQTRDYETAAHYRDTQYKPAKDKLSHIQGFMFKIYGFYEIDFFIENDTIEISYPIGLEYGASSLVKVLLDLGGNFEDPRISYPKRWMRLRKWEDYSRWNRPRK